MGWGMTHAPRALLTCAYVKLLIECPEGKSTAVQMSTTVDCTGVISALHTYHWQEPDLRKTSGPLDSREENSEGTKVLTVHMHRQLFKGILWIII